MSLTDQQKTNNWQMSSTNQGEIVTGIDDINQSILNIISTQKGSDPVNPLFGVDIMKYIDRPVQQIAPVLLKEILTSINLWESRVIVDKITYTIDLSNITFDVSWSMNDLTGQITKTYATA